jgi:hypothetical protein
MPIPSLPLDIWHKILVLLDIKEAIALSKAYPRFFGAFIESNQGIRFRNAINSYMRSDAVDLPAGPLPSFLLYYAKFLFDFLCPCLLDRSTLSTRPLFEYR